MPLSTRTEIRGDVVHDEETWHTLDDLWRHGSLEHLLDQTQREIYDFVRNSTASTVYVLASRQLGKSFVDVVIAIEDCLRNPCKRVNYVAKTFGSLKKMMEQTMQFVINQAPPECRPEFNTTESRWVFPMDGPGRGSFIQLVGADEHRGADRCRGGSVVRNIIDEAGFIDCLEYLLNSVLKPMGLRSHAKTLLSSSPAFTPDHYSCQVEDLCAANGALIMRDYWSPGLQSREEKEKFLSAQATDMGLSLEKFMKTTHYRREYGCERVLDESLAVVPEFAEARSRIVVERERPPHFDLYISMDPGMDDLTGILFAISDFRRSKLVVEHELLLSRANTKAIADAIHGVLGAHYPTTPDDRNALILNVVDGVEGIFHVHKPYVSVVDANKNATICSDLYSQHALSFAPAELHDREGGINVMRLAIQAGDVEINPRCVGLVRQLSNAIRQKIGGDMARSAKDGHFDLVSALRYMIRSWNRGHNPYPGDFGFDRHTQTRREMPRPQSLSQIILKGTSLARR